MAEIYLDECVDSDVSSIKGLADLDSLPAKEWNGDFDPQKTKDVALPYITSHVPNASSPSLVGRVSVDEATSPSFQRVNAYQTELKDYAKKQIPSELPSLDHETFLEGLKEEFPEFPNLALEAVKAGLEKERIVTAKINGYITEAESNQKDIDLLLDLSAELTAYKEDEEMPEKIKNLFSQLKARGIDIHKGEETSLSKEKISELKSLASAQVEKFRSNLNILFSTKIQPLIQSISAIMDAIKDIIRSNARVVNAANRLPGH